jgi:hypothetical protein
VSGYIEAGYVVALGSLATYAVSLVTRERAARHRLPPAPVEPQPTSSRAPDANREAS